MRTSASLPLRVLVVDDSVFHRRSMRLASPMPARAPQAAPAAPVEARPQKQLVPPKNVIAVASSTGGPSALMEIFTRFPANYRNALVIAQHMPDKFARTFAERLSRRGALKVSEAQDQDVVSEGTGFGCPGRHCMELEVSARGTMN